MTSRRLSTSKQNKSLHAIAAAAALATAPLCVRAGVSFDASSTSKWTFAADLNTLSQVQNQNVNPPPSSGSMPVAPSYQLNKPFSSGTASSLAKGSIGYVTNSTTASFTLQSGSGVSQTDPNNVYTGASSLKCDFDGRFNPTSPSFGPPATGYVSVSVGGTVGVSGYTRFLGQVQFLNANTGAALRTTVNFDQTFNVAGPFSHVFVSSATLSPSTIPVGTPVRVKGFFQFLASNEGTPSEMTPIDVEFSAAPPTATYFLNADGDWNSPASWTPPAGSTVENDGSIPTVPQLADQRARFINNFTTPHTTTLSAPTTVGTIQVDTAQDLTIAGSAANSLTMNVTGGEAVIEVKNTSGSDFHDGPPTTSGVHMNAPVSMADSLQVQTELNEVPLRADGRGSFIDFNQALSGSGALMKTGAGSATLAVANTYNGGTQARGGYLNANAPASLSNGTVIANDGQLNYNANGAALSGLATAQTNGQINLGVTAGPADHFAAQDLGAVSGSPAELASLSLGANLNLAPGSMIAHEAFNTGSAGNPQGLAGLPPSIVFGIAQDFLDVGTAQITVGDASASPWIGFGGDRGDRIFGVNTATTEQQVTIAGNAQLVSLHNALLLNAQLNSTASASFTKRGGGIVVIANTNNLYTGSVTVAQGSLLIDGNLPGATSTVVQSGATLGGKGTLGGTVNVQNGGHLAPGSVTETDLASTLTINGGLTLAANSFLDFDLSTPVVGMPNDKLMINGPLTLDGILNVNGLPDFAPGAFTLFQTTGPITDLGLTLGRVPDGFTLNFSIVQPQGVNPGSVIVNTTPIPSGSTWIGSLGTNWTDASNWTNNAVPNGSGAIANLIFSPGVNHTINLNTSQTIGTLNIDSMQPYTISAGAASIALSFDVPSGGAAVNVLTGGHTINAPINLIKGTTFNIAPDSMLSVLHLRGAGATLTTGTLRILPNGTAAARSTVTSLTMNGGATPTAKLDITNNALVVDYAAADPDPTNLLRLQILAAYNVGVGSGHWQGKGITSSMATDSTYGIGYAKSSALGGNIPAIFGPVDADAVLIRLTRYGDADLNGIVNLIDFNRLSSNFNQLNRLWSDGDFNYDGRVNLLDFNLLSANFNMIAITSDPTPQDWANLAAAVPEPVSAIAMSVPTLALMSSRRRRKR